MGNDLIFKGSKAYFIYSALITIIGLTLVLMLIAIVPVFFVLAHFKNHEVSGVLDTPGQIIIGILAIIPIIVFLVIFLRYLTYKNTFYQFSPHRVMLTKGSLFIDLDIDNIVSVVCSQSMREYITKSGSLLITTNSTAFNTLAIKHVTNHYAIYEILSKLRIQAKNKRFETQRTVQTVQNQIPLLDQIDPNNLFFD